MKKLNYQLLSRLLEPCRHAGYLDWAWLEVLCYGREIPLVGVYYSISLESYPHLHCNHPNIKNYSDKKKKGKSFCVSIGSELTLAQVIKAHREGEGWTLEEAAQKLGMSRQALHQYESGAGLPSIEQTVRLANGLGAMPDMWLIYRIEAELRNQGMDYKVILKRRA